MTSFSIRAPCLALTLCGVAVFAMPASAVMPTRSGTIPPEVARAFESRLFEVPDAGGRLPTSVAQAVWNVPVILVGFSDQPLGSAIYGGLTPAQHFDRALFDTTGATPTGSVFDYYTWVSGNRIRVVGRVVATISLPAVKDYYANNNWGLSPFPPRNSYGFVTAALQYSDPVVDWRPFDQNHDTFVDMLWVVHSGLPGEATVTRDNLWSITSRLSSWSGGEAFETRTPVPGAPGVPMRVDRFSVLPEISAAHFGQPADIGVYCHEFGHALGLPDLYDTSTLGGGADAGPGNWSLMATGAYGTDGLSPEYPSHLGAWPMVWLGWRETVRPTMDSLVVHGPLAAGAPIVDFWFQGEANHEHFLIENRQRMGFDRNLPAEGLIVYQLNETVIAQGLAGNRVNYGNTTGLRLVEADGLNDLIVGRNRGDSHDPFPGLFERTEFDDETTPNTRSFRGAVTNIALREIEPLGDDMRYLLQVRTPGWQPVVSATSGWFNPIWPSSPANRGLMLPDHSVVLAVSEPRAGRPQILLRSRSHNGPWGEPIQVSESPHAATDPSIGVLPGGSDLVVVWSDGRHGASELYYRSRIGGAWTSERRLTNLAGGSRHPSVGVDRYGRVHVAWQYTEGSLTQVRFMSFTYFSPFGTPLEVSPSTHVPDAPVVAVTPGGVTHVFWSNRGTLSSVWSAQYRPAVGLTLPEPVAPGNGFSQPAIDAVADPSGTVHVAWQVSGSGVNQIHYQRRPGDGAMPSPFDTVVVSRTESVQNPVLRVDDQQWLHLAFVANAGGVQQIRYKLRRPHRGWDYGSTEVTMPADGSAARPVVVPGHEGEVSVLYFGSLGGSLQLLERRRRLFAGSVAAPEPFRPTPSFGLRLGPNPLRAGSPLVLQLATPAAGVDEIDVYDLAGRRITSVRLRVRGDLAEAEVPGHVTGSWPSGVYFARPRGAAIRPARLVVLR